MSRSGDLDLPKSSSPGSFGSPDPKGLNIFLRKMKIVKSVKEMQKISTALKRKGKAIGFVPTMGYLHQGHLSLIRLAKKKSDVVMVSIFVNPIQFGPKEDFKRYPRDLKRDTRLARKTGCDILFIPTQRQMYPERYSAYVSVEKLSDTLEGKFRMGHFKGVATVVAKLFNIVQPDLAFFGQKDAQQAVIIQKMVEDLNFNLKIIIGPTVREPSGLALSSRNSYLAEDEKKTASVLFQSLQKAQSIIEQGERNSSRVIHEMEKMILSKPKTIIDYIAITDSQTLEPLENLSGEVLISMAVFVGSTRLIDNLKLKVQ